MDKQRQFLGQATWFVLAVNVAVVLWGAYVRASGSGAGCGDHWPLCNGLVVPVAPESGTVIELAHRVTSAMAVVLVLAVAAFSTRTFPRGHRVRSVAFVSVASIIVEALIGAVIVLASFTGNNTSSVRALVVALHLLNTLVLIGALTLTAWWAGGAPMVRWREHPASAALFIGGALGYALLGSSGAITALGDTLFPSSTLAQGMQLDLAVAVNLLIRLRVLHPMFATFMGVFAIAMAIQLSRKHGSAMAQKLVGLHSALFFTQCAIGLLNLLWLAPIPLQLLHLLCANLVWIAYVLLASCALSQPAVIRTPDVILRRPAATCQ